MNSMKAATSSLNNNNNNKKLRKCLSNLSQIISEG